MVNAPAHGKGVVDGLNAVTKRYLRECMRRICKADKANENDVELKRKFENWMHIGDKQKSFAEQAKKLCEDEDRKDGVKSAGPKRQKRMQNKKINKRHYFVTHADEVQYSSVNMNTIILPSSKKKIDGKTPKQSGILTRYNFRADPRLGVGKIAVRRIPCTCRQCMKQLALPWDESKDLYSQDRYAQNKDCEKWNVFQGTNDWEIATIKFAKGTDEELIQDFPKLVMQEVEVTMAMNICRGSFAALNVDAVREFDIVEILSDVDLSGKDRVVTVRFWQPLKTGCSWYIQTEETEVVRVMHIVNPDVQMLSITEANMLPRGFPQGVPPLSNSHGCRTRQTPD